MKKRNIKLACMVLSIIMIFTLMPVLAIGERYDELIIDNEVSAEMQEIYERQISSNPAVGAYGCVEHQIKMLMKLAYGESADIIKSMGTSREINYHDIPTIYGYSLPDAGAYTFVIALAIYDYCESWTDDELLEASARPIAQEKIDFIVEFTGIPYEIIEIGYAKFRRPRRLPNEDFVAPEYCPVWGTSFSEMENMADNRAPVIIEMRIGMC